MMTPGPIMMSLAMMTLSRLSLPPASPPHVHIAARHSAPEEHVEDLLSRHARLERVIRVVILVEPVCDSSVTSLAPCPRKGHTASSSHYLTTRRTPCLLK